MTTDIPTNLLYFGDNLEWLRNRDKFPDESVDLIYLDPPFNSNRSYNVLFKESDVHESESQIHAFEDTWSWDSEGRVQAVFDDFWLHGPDKPKEMLKALIDALRHNDVTAYLTMMAPRLVELHRVLRPTGSLYLHCDPTASHYLKVLLDAIFGPKNFRNEVIWRRTRSHNDAKLARFGAIHDVLLFYGKSPKTKFVRQLTVRDPDAAVSHDIYRHTDGKLYRKGDCRAPGERGPLYEWNGHVQHWRFTEERARELEDQGLIVYSRTGMPRVLRPYEPSKGSPLQSIWTDLDSPNSGSQEHMGYPTQKPLALLERIVAASSNEDDVVLDPFCGCGTTVHAAHKLNRRWIGIDITPVATDLMRRRLQDAFPGLKVPIDGWPADLAGAKKLAEMDDKYHFQDWAVIQAEGRPAGGTRKKGADRGIDGVIPFIDGSAGPKRGVISVKAGKTGPAHVRELAGVVERDEGTEFGVFICTNKPTKTMNEEALEHGTWISEYDGELYPRMQILSAQDLIDEKPVRMPQGARSATFTRAQREKKTEGKQGKLT